MVSSCPDGHTYAQGIWTEMTSKDPNTPLQLASDCVNKNYSQKLSCALSRAASAVPTLMSRKPNYKCQENLSYFPHLCNNFHETTTWSILMFALQTVCWLSPPSSWSRALAYVPLKLWHFSLNGFLLCVTYHTITDSPCCVPCFKCIYVPEFGVIEQVFPLIML